MTKLQGRLESLLTERQAAEIMNISVYWLQKARSQRIGPQYVKVGSAIRYRPSALEEYLNRDTADLG